MSSLFPTVLDSSRALPLYLTSVGIFYNEVSVHRPQGYIDYQWLQTASGHGIIHLGNEEVLLDESKGLLIPSNIPHSYKRESEQWLTHWVSFNGTMIPSLFHTLGFSDIGTYTQFNTENTTSILKNIFELTEDNYTKNAFPISTRLYALIEQIYASKIASNTPLHSKGNQLQLLFDYIDQHYMLDITLNDLSQHIHVSPQYVCRLFNSYLSMRPFEYIKHVRIGKSKSLLNQVPSLPIEQIAEMVGFHNPSYFTALFKSIEKITPREFVQIHQRGVK